MKDLRLALSRRMNTIGDHLVSSLPRFKAIQVAAANSLCDKNRLLGLQKVADETARRDLCGDIVECGVYRGGSAIVIAERLLRRVPSRQVWLFDVFNGMPEPGPNDPAEAWDDVGKFVSSEGIVRSTFAAAGLPLNCLRIVAGRYETTLLGIESFSVIFLHVDCDWYASVKVCLHTFYDAVVPGGAIVFDDYGYWSGCRKAVDEFLAERSVKSRLTPIDFTSHYFFKP